MARLSEKLRRFLASTETNAARDVTVSAAFVLPPGEIGRISSHVLSVIDRVHSDGELPIIAIEKSVAAKRYSAAYQSHKSAVGDGKNRAYRILLSKANDTLFLSLCHEIGHFIDEQGFGTAKPASIDLPNAYFDAWLLRVIRSDAAKDLMAMARNGVADIFLPEGGFIQAMVGQKYIGYLLSPDELWARSYSQYIAVKSGDALLLNELEAERRSEQGRIYYPKQWTEWDFTPIMEAMDDIFHDRGWLI